MMQRTSKSTEHPTWFSDGFACNIIVLGNINIIKTGVEMSEAGHKQVVAPEIMDMTRVNYFPLEDRYSMEYKCRQYRE